MSATRTDTTPTVAERGLSRILTLPPPSPGFIGRGHTAVHAIEAREFEHNDPFIGLADDYVDIPRGQRAGGAHPHAGFEIVTFIVEGDIRDRHEGLLRAGDVAWMTAGSGVVHSEDIEPLGKVRILQLWVTLPSAMRWVRHASRIKPSTTCRLVENLVWRRVCTVGPRGRCTPVGTPICR